MSAIGVNAATDAASAGHRKLSQDLTTNKGENMKETTEKLKELSTQMREQAALALTVHNQVEREIAVLEGAENAMASQVHSALVR